MCLTKVLFQVSTHAHFHLIPAIQNQKINMTDNCDIRKRVMQAADITEFQRRVYLECIRPKCSDFRVFGVIAKFVIKNSCLI